MAGFVLRELAREDLEEIWLYILHEWNAEPADIDMLASLVKDNLQGWVQETEDASARQQRAQALGAGK